jgi:hypothetical protein
MRNPAWAPIKKETEGCLHGCGVYFRGKTIAFHSAKSIRSRLAFYDLRALLVELSIFRGSRKYKKMLVAQGWLQKEEYLAWCQTSWLRLNTKFNEIRARFIFMKDCV